jgi:hypothetical protein
LHGLKASEWPKDPFVFLLDHDFGVPNRAFLEQRQAVSDEEKCRCWQAELSFSDLACSRLFYSRVCLP